MHLNTLTLSANSLFDYCCEVIRYFIFFGRIAYAIANASVKVITEKSAVPMSHGYAKFEHALCFLTGPVQQPGQRRDLAHALLHFARQDQTGAPGGAVKQALRLLAGRARQGARPGRRQETPAMDRTSHGSRGGPPGVKSTPINILR